MKFKNDVMGKLSGIFLRGLTGGDPTSSVFQTHPNPFQTIVAVSFKKVVFFFLSFLVSFFFFF